MALPPGVDPSDPKSLADYVQSLQGGNTSGAPAATVGPPNATPSEDEISYIVQQASSGKQLSTQQVLALQTALAGSQSIQNTQLRHQAAQALQGASNQIQGQVGQTYNADVGADADLGAAGTWADTGDQSALGGLSNAAANTYGNNTNVANYYADTAAGMNGIDMADVGQLAGAGQQSNNLEQQALFGLLGKQYMGDQADIANVAGLQNAANNVGFMQGNGYGPDLQSQFKDLTNPTISAPERFNMELARQQEEQTQRAALQRALADQSARGVQSGGAEVGAMLGSGQNASQNRMLADMNALSQANSRAMAARQQLDSVSEFNKAQSLAQQNWQNEFQQKQKQQGFQNQQQVANTQQAATGAAWNRAQNIYQGSQQNAANQYGRAADLYGAETGRTDAAFGRAGNVANFGANVNTQGYGMQKDLTGAQMTADQAGFGRQQDVTGAQKNTNQAAFNNAMGGFNTQGAVAGVQTGTSPQPIYQATSNQIANNETSAALSNAGQKSGLEKVWDDTVGSFI